MTASTDRPGLALAGRLALAWALALWAAPLTSAEGVLPALEMDRPPTAAAAGSLLQAAERHGWPAVAGELRERVLSAYEARSRTAREWYLLFRWAELWGRSELEALRDWAAAIDRSGAGHPNMAREYRPGAGALGDRWPAGVKAFALGDQEFSAAFFRTIVPEDSLGEVLSVLARLEKAEPERFRRWWNLALAIAVVHDVPPPPGWPHFQVAPAVLPRRLPPAEEAFRFWADAAESGRTLVRFDRLGPAELKFVVDATAPLAELKWAQGAIRTPLAEFSGLYSRIRYRADRIEAGAYGWTLPDYALPTILREGGICVDQAYFASQAGKAQGVPTLLFRGVGLDGRHAWFGYLSREGWVLDAGRYAEQRYVAGLAYDPQTWRNISDHALLFLSEGFHQLPSYGVSEGHADIAREYLADGRMERAESSAREAVRTEPRNLRGWEMLVAAVRADVREYEGTLRRAAYALRRYPDLEADFLRRLIESLRRRGETSRAEHEERQLARKYRGGREDLTVQQIAEMMRESRRNEDLAGQVRTYQRLLAGFGYGGGMDLFDGLVGPFVADLLSRGAKREALLAVESAQRTLRVEAGSQLERELNQLAARAK